MRVSVVLLWLSLSCVQLQRGDDQLTVEDTQSGLNRLQNQSRVERSELNPNQPDVWTELRELRDMVVEQMVQIQLSHCQIEELKKENAAMNNRLLELIQVNSALEGRVVSNELGVEALREENANRPKVAFSFSSGLNGHLGPLGVDTILVFSKEITNIGNAYSPITALKWSLEALREGNANVRKVAFLFGSGLNGVFGPFNVETTLIFRKQITNVGNAYSPITGVFTAPLRGVYYFRFNVFGSNSYWMTIDLYKNQERIITAAEYPGGQHEYSVGGATLLLQKGDLVYLKLRATCQIYDSADNLTTFTGFLLFPM